jgi:predicted ATP-grasp superfamily ATP-dependent carboligase
MEIVGPMSGTKKKLTVLVTDGENRSSLAVTRSLGRHGCKVIVTGQQKKNLASSSRYCAERYAVPSPLHAGPAYLAAMRNILIEQKIDVLFPMTELSILLLAERRDQLPQDTILACPSLDKVRTVFDKFAVFRLAQELGIAIPQTIFVEDRDDFLTKRHSIHRFPVVVKPAMSKIPINNGFLSTSVKYAIDQTELEKLYETEAALDFPSMIQEKVIGPGTGLFTLFQDGRHLALFSHQRLREKPPSGGVSVVCESVPLDLEMVEASQKLLAAVNWEGVAMVEFKRDLKDSRAKLMEINGRFWGSLQLAIASGVDFPVLFLHQLTESTQEQENSLEETYRTGLKMKWFLGTLDHLLIRIRNKEDTLNLPPGSGSKTNALYEFLQLKGKNTVFDVIDRKDLGPFWCEVQAYVSALLK